MIEFVSVSRAVFYLVQIIFRGKYKKRNEHVVKSNCFPVLFFNQIEPAFLVIDCHLDWSMRFWIVQIEICCTWWSSRASFCWDNLINAMILAQSRQVRFCGENCICLKMRMNGHFFFCKGVSGGYRVCVKQVAVSSVPPLSLWLRPFISSLQWVLSEQTKRELVDYIADLLQMETKFVALLATVFTCGTLVEPCTWPWPWKTTTDSIRPSNAHKHDLVCSLTAERNKYSLHDLIINVAIREGGSGWKRKPVARSAKLDLGD